GHEIWPWVTWWGIFISVCCYSHRTLQNKKQPPAHMQEVQEHYFDKQTMSRTSRSEFMGFCILKKKEISR
ncbi:hypothetical protein, partial [Salmonella sp. gx-f7]|uniref:hypothetical protein n=1 Tax=Salmonella sp. gx-f7 TaxID=2582606 RepID=UPI001F3CA279